MIWNIPTEFFVSAKRNYLHNTEICLLPTLAHGFQYPIRVLTNHMIWNILYRETYLVPQHWNMFIVSRDLELITWYPTEFFITAKHSHTRICLGLTFAHSFKAKHFFQGNVDRVMQILDSVLTDWESNTQHGETNGGCARWNFLKKHFKTKQKFRPIVDLKLK